MVDRIKVVLPEEMARLEKGGDLPLYMEQAGLQVARACIRYIEKKGLPKRISLLAGKGNNGGDAYSAGFFLLDAGYEVSSLALDGEGTFLNRQFREKFSKKGGKSSDHLEGLIVDGLFGTGFKGKADGSSRRIIERANQSGLPILSIDIPSGLNGADGKVEGAAIFASETVALGLPKIGCFVKEGWNHTGRLEVADIGFPQSILDQAEAAAYLQNELLLPKIIRNRNKYQAGYLIGYSGSKQFPGAPKLAGLAALRTGAGVVRIFHKEEIGPAPFELICTRWSENSWKEALGKAQAVFIGPGLGSAETWLKRHLKQIKVPCVIDADALLPGISYPKHAVLTPHRGEVFRLLNLKKTIEEEDLFEAISRFCTDQGLFLVLKGAPTFIFGPGSLPIIVPRGDPGMATAGAGDVLTGIIGALLAQGCSPCDAAVLGAALHGIGGEKGAQQKSSYSLIASDLIESLPLAFQSLINNRQIGVL